MNVIINGFHSPSQFPILRNIIKFLDVKKCYIFCDDREIILPKDIEVQFFHDNHINQTADYVSNWSDILPLDDKLLKEMSYCEFMTLRMMDRLMWNSKFESYNFRKYLYMKHLRYWNHVFQTEKIDLIINSGLPHQVYDYIIYCLGKFYSIPMICLYQLQVEDTFIFFDSMEEPNITLKNHYYDLITEYKEIPIEKIPLSPRFNNYYERQVDKKKDSTPFYMYLIHPKESKIKKYISFFKDKTRNMKRFISKLHPQNLVKIYFIYRYEHSLFKYYESKTSEPDLNKKFIFVALHYQPELSTSPLAGAFNDQFLIVQLLSSLIPKDCLLYVKDHPVQRYLCRNFQFYHDIISLPNVRLITRSYSSIKLIEKCVATATCTGTAGWEAVFREKPVLLFGVTYYQYVKGVFSIHSYDDAKNSLHKIFEFNERPNIKDVKIFMKALDDTSVEGFIDPFFMHVTKLTSKQNIQNVTKALLNQFEKKNINKK